MNKTYNKRELYLRKFLPYIGKDLIKVIVGQRRVGKSYMLYQLMDAVKEQDPDVDIIAIDKESHEFEHIRTHEDLQVHVKQAARPKARKHALFIDEVQDIEGFEKALRSLNASGKYDIYCTGSNARLLSGELADLLSGRYIEIAIHSLSYREFLSFHRMPEASESFLKFLKYGGLPYLIHLSLEDEVVYDYLKNVSDTILFKDIIKRFQIRNVAFLERLVEYLAENTGNLVSAKKICDFLKSQRMSISPNIVLDYISHLIQAFFVHRVPRSDIKGKKVFEINEKYYFEDLGLRHAIVGVRQTDIQKVLENVVYNHFSLSGYDITVGQLGSKEVDFVCEKQGERIYVQVAYLITEENKEREFGNLLSIPDNYPKLVVSMDEEVGSGSYKGIEHVNVRRLLSS
jgi:uncharacterized protein